MTRGYLSSRAPFTLDWIASPKIDSLHIVWPDCKISTILI